MSVKSIGHDGKILFWRDCPKCGGRGTFLINPFATGGGNGAGGPNNLRQCESCEAAWHENERRQAVAEREKPPPG